VRARVRAHVLLHVERAAQPVDAIARPLDAAAHAVHAIADAPLQLLDERLGARAQLIDLDLDRVHVVS
jgi:hypothetical protein